MEIEDAAKLAEEMLAENFATSVEACTVCRPAG